jgi:hypothetical protein
MAMKTAPLLLLLAAGCSGAPEGPSAPPFDATSNPPAAPSNDQTLEEAGRPREETLSVDGIWRICPPRAEPDRAYYIPYGGYRVELKRTGDVLEARLSGEVNDWKNDQFLRGPYDAKSRVWSPSFYWQHWTAEEPMDAAHVKLWFENAATFTLNATANHLVGPFMADAPYGGTVVGGRENGDFSCPKEDEN